MKERPILFSAPMVRAILAGTKTQTRRALSDRVMKMLDAAAKAGECNHLGALDVIRENDQAYFAQFSPYGQPGDRLWVRETYFAWGRWETRFSAKKGRDEWHFIDMTQEAGHQYSYPADGRFIAPHRRTGGVNPTFWKRPAIFMPREASRITLEVTGVRVERLQDISEEDAIAEGCTQNHNGYFWGGPHAVSGLKQMATAKQAYSDLWESINGPESWDANPWVWAVEFKRLEAAT